MANDERLGFQIRTGKFKPVSPSALSRDSPGAKDETPKKSNRNTDRNWNPQIQLFVSAVVFALCWWGGVSTRPNKAWCYKEGIRCVCSAGLGPTYLCHTHHIVQASLAALQSICQAFGPCNFIPKLICECIIRVWHAVPFKCNDSSSAALCVAMTA